MAVSLKDRDAIMDLRSHYSWALDNGDGAAYAATFTPDGVFDGPPEPEGPGYLVGRGALQRLIDGVRDLPFAEGMQHMVYSPIFEGNNERCTVRWMSIAPHRQGDDISIHAVAAYVDTCVKIDGKWYFEHMIYRLFHRQAAREIGASVNWSTYTGD